MATSELIQALEDLARDRNVDDIYLIDRLETCLAKHYEKKLDLTEDCRVTIDRQSGKIFVYVREPVGERDPETKEFTQFVEKDVTPPDVSYWAARVVKSELQDIVRQAGRKKTYEDYKNHVGELVSATVLQVMPEFAIVKIAETNSDPGVEAELPYYDISKNPNERNERPEGEHYHHNQRMRVLIVDVRDVAEAGSMSKSDSTRSVVVVSRKHPDLIRRLFEFYVPEVYKGVVVIKNVEREAGSRSKIAVYSLDPKVDPVGACVGPKGSRVRSIVEELHNERIDVIQWSENPARFIENALSPARISKVLIDETRNYATVIVPDDQLSLAIGSAGQNARLAARLTGWHIDIKSASYSGYKPEEQDDDLIEEEKPAFDEMCAYVSADGVKCRNHARPGSRYCGIHGSADN